MTAVATSNFRLVDRLLDIPTVPAAEKQFKALGTPAARHLMRHQAAEMNRFFFENWGLAQVVLAAAVLGVIVFGVKARPLQLKFMLCVAGFALILTLIGQFVILPSIVGIGRVLDFTDPPAFAADRTRFGNFHTAYSTLEIVKMLCCAGLAVMLMTFTGGKRRRSAKLDEDGEVGAWDMRRQRPVSH